MLAISWLHSLIHKLDSQAWSSIHSPELDSKFDLPKVGQHFQNAAQVNYVRAVHTIYMHFDYETYLIPWDPLLVVPISIINVNIHKGRGSAFWSTRHMNLTAEEVLSPLEISQTAKFHLHAVMYNDSAQYALNTTLTNFSFLPVFGIRHMSRKSLQYYLNDWTLVPIGVWSHHGNLCYIYMHADCGIMFSSLTVRKIACKPSN